VKPTAGLLNVVQTVTLERVRRVLLKSGCSAENSKRETAAAPGQSTVVRVLQPY